MALTEIQIEQITGGSWVARIEVGGMIAKRVTVTAAEWPEALAAVDTAYREIAGIQRAPVAPAVTGRRLAGAL